MSKVVIFSLDYDGCASILFNNNAYLVRKQHYEYYMLDPKDPTRQPYRKGAEEYVKLHDLRHELHAFLDREAKGADIVELYIGSNRQSYLLDQINDKIHHNGLCFTNFPELCKKRGWRFRPLLLADVHHNVPAGSVFNGDTSCQCDSPAHFNRDKIEIINNQLLDAAKNHPTDEVHFKFLDDDKKKTILPGLQAHFANEMNREKSKHINLDLYEFDYQKAFEQNTKALKEIAHIPGKPVVAVTTLVDSGVNLLFSPAVPANGSSVQVQNTTPTDTATPAPTSSTAPGQSLAFS